MFVMYSVHVLVNRDNFMTASTRYFDAHNVSSTDLCGNTGTFVKSVATLGNVEENDTVSRALARLSEVEEKVETIHSDQVCRSCELLVRDPDDRLKGLCFSL